MNKSPDTKKKGKKKNRKSATDGEIAKISKRERTGMGGVQIGTQGDNEKPSGARKGREVRDLG